MLGPPTPAELDRIMGLPANPLPPGGHDPAKPSPPNLSLGRVELAGLLPEYGTLEYLEKLGLVLLTIAALLYVAGKGFQSPGRAIAAAAAARGVKG